MSTTTNRGTLASRLARHLTATAAIAASPLVLAESASADVNYHVYNAVIPANIDGIYVNVETYATGTAGSAVPGWDINPYSATALTWFNATGTGMMRFPGVTTGSAGNLALNTPIGPTGSYGSGTVVVGAAPGNWQLNAVNMFGFRFLAADGQTRYGWGRIQVGATITQRTLIDIGWETTPNTVILAGNEGGGPPDYDPCAPFNPQVGIGANSLPMNQDTATALDLSGSCGLVIYKANYFKFVAPVAGQYTFSTCASGEDTRMAVLDGCAAGSNVLACNDDACGSSSSISVNLESGATYYCVIGAASGKATLTSPVLATVTSPPNPSCIDASTAPFGTSYFSNDGVTADVTVKASTTGGTAIIHKAKWYRFTPTVTGTYSLSVCGSNNDTKMAIAAACPGVGTNFDSIGYNDDFCACSTGCGTTTQANWASRIDGATTGIPLTQELVAGQDYFILVGGYSATTAAVSGDLVIDGPPQNVPGDINGDGVVDAADLAALLGAWDTSDPMADINGDGLVDAADLSILLGNWSM